MIRRGKQKIRKKGESCKKKQQKRSVNKSVNKFRIFQFGVNLKNNSSQQKTDVYRLRKRFFSRRYQNLEKRNLEENFFLAMGFEPGCSY